MVALSLPTSKIESVVIIMDITLDLPSFIAVIVAIGSLIAYFVRIEMRVKTLEIPKADATKQKRKKSYSQF